MAEKRMTNEYVEMKMGRIEQACQRYGLGRTTMRAFAQDAGAIVKVGKCCLYNFSKLDAYVDYISEREF